MAPPRTRRRRLPTRLRTALLTRLSRVCLARVVALARAQHLLAPRHGGDGFGALEVLLEVLLETLLLTQLLVLLTVLLVDLLALQGALLHLGCACAWFSWRARPLGQTEARERDRSGRCDDECCTHAGAPSGLGLSELALTVRVGS